MRECPGNVNGYNVTNYPSDTAVGNAHQRGGFALPLGSGGFTRGTASVTSDGCTAKLVLDEEVHDVNGPVDQLHFEMAMII